MKLVATALALFTLASPAAAAVDPGQVYGGGHYGSRNAIVGNAIAFAEINADGTAMRLFVQASAKCGTGSVDAQSVPIAADGSFTLAGTNRDRTFFGDRRTTTYSGSGSFDGVHATGTLHQTVKIAKQKACSNDVAFSLREDLPADANPRVAAPLADTEYDGRTSQGWGFVLRSNSAATGVTGAAFNYDLKCGKRTDFTGEFTPSFKVAADHSFVIKENFKIRYAEGVQRFTVRGAGTFAEGAVFGTVRITANFRDKKKKRITERCKTPAIDFSAAP